MKIRSRNFRDYYDSVQAFGYEDDLLYIRETKEVEDEGHCPYQVKYIGFAGKIYPLIQPSCIHDNTYCFSVEDYDKIVELPRENFLNSFDYFSKQKKEAYYHGNERGTYKWKSYGTTRAALSKFYKSSPFIEFFDKYKVPIFIVHNTQQMDSYNKVMVELNPCLRPYDFARILPPYQAYQQLYMYLSNQARPEKPIPRLDDRTMSEIKGFDKYSFRKCKSK